MYLPNTSVEGWTKDDTSGVTYRGSNFRVDLTLQPAQQGSVSAADSTGAAISQSCSLRISRSFRLYEVLFTFLLLRLLLPSERIRPCVETVLARDQTSLPSHVGWD